MTEKNNLAIWEQVCKTNPNHTKEAGFGRKMTAIDAQYQVQEATRVFGPIGLGWGTKDELYHEFLVDENDPQSRIIRYTAKLWYKHNDEYGEFPIVAEIQMFSKTKNGTKYNEDCYKKVQTDALTKGLSRLGFSADIFLGLYEDNKYVAQLKQEFKGKDTVQQKVPGKSEMASIGELGKFLMANGVQGAELSEFLNTNSGVSDWKTSSPEQLKKLETMLKKLVALKKCEQELSAITDQKKITKANKVIKEYLGGDLNTSMKNNSLLLPETDVKQFEKLIGEIQGCN